LNCQYDLVRHFLEEQCVLLRVPISFPAYETESADTLSLKGHGQNTYGLNAFRSETALVPELGRILEIATHARLLMLVHPTDAGFAAPILYPRLEIVR
jgi:hypothetical protein